jgi:hypothetical protein
MFLELILQILSKSELIMCFMMIKKQNHNKKYMN